MKPYFEDGGLVIYNADCRKVLPEIEAHSIDVIWTDPPYGHNNHFGDFNSRLNDYRGLEQQPIKNDTQDLMKEVVDEMLEQAARVLKPESSCCCCCCCGGGGPSPTFAWIANRMDIKGMKFFHAVVWDKLNPGLGWRYRRQYEMIMVAHLENGKLSWNKKDDAIPNIFRMMPERERLHPNEKPVSLVSYFLSAHLPLSGIVLDPFMGSGTTLRAAKNLGNRAIGIEIEESYCEVAANRLRQEVLFK